MHLSPTIVAAGAAVCVGIAALWSNPERTVNRAFFSTSIHVALWLACVQVAVALGEHEWWIRLASAIGAYVVVHMWLLKEACIHGTGFWQNTRRKLVWWLIAATVLAACCFTRWYVVSGRFAEGQPHFGPLYYFYVFSVVLLFAMLCRETVRQIRTQTGLSRLELQIVLLGGTATALAVMFLMGLRALVGVTWPIQLQPILVFIFYSGTVVAITTHRILDARQIVRVVLQRSVLVLTAAALAFLLLYVLQEFEVPRPVALVLMIAIVLWAATLLSDWLDRFMGFYPQAPAVRQAAFAAARREGRIENLETAFKSIVKGWGHSERAVIVYGPKDSLRGDGIELTGDSAVMHAMRNLRWATPERLSRERTTPERAQLGRFLAQHALAALVATEGATLDTLVGVGQTAARRPFTYPQITQLTELASIIGSALERVHLSNKAQHAEQLATVGLLGASLAHEIRNPLVTIKTFVQLLPAHYQDAAFRDKFFRLMGDEVDRMDRLTEQLLDLASPRTYAATELELHPILGASLELVASRAAHRQVEILTDFAASPDLVYTDGAAAKQVILNLCLNAIQAVDGNDEGPRRVRLATRNVGSAVEVAVTDSGPGIAPEMLPRLFQPFQTTKSSGFGLGLAICSDILANLDASISVDPPVPGRGATFRVTFPCQPS